MILLAFTFVADQFISFMLPDKLLHVQRRRALDEGPAVAPIPDVVGHLNRVLLGALAGKFQAQKTFERRRDSY